MGPPAAIGALARRMIAENGLCVREPGNFDPGIEILTIGLRPGDRLSEPDMRRGAVPSGVHPAILTARPEHFDLTRLDALLDSGLAAVKAFNAEAIRQILQEVTSARAMDLLPDRDAEDQDAAPAVLDRPAGIRSGYATHAEPAERRRAPDPTS